MEDLLSQAAAELEDLRHWNKSQQQQQQHATPEKQSRDTSPKHKRFPTACIHLLRSIPGNLRCVDCDATNPQWASISYGILLCIECSGKHRQMGVQVCLFCTNNCLFIYILFDIFRINHQSAYSQIMNSIFFYIFYLLSLF
jgi:hypothetical protein